MFPHEEYLLKAMKCTDFRMIGLLNDLAGLYTTEMSQRATRNFDKAAKIGEAIKRCAQEVAEIQGDDPVSGGHAEDIIM